MSPYNNRLKSLWQWEKIPLLQVRPRPSAADAARHFRLFQAVARLRRRERPIRVSALFAWNSLWVGFHWNPQKRWLLFLPLPMVGLLFEFGPAERASSL